METFKKKKERRIFEFIVIGSLEEGRTDTQELCAPSFQKSFGCLISRLARGRVLSSVAVVVVRGGSFKNSLKLPRQGNNKRDERSAARYCVE